MHLRNVVVLTDKHVARAHRQRGRVGRESSSGAKVIPNLPCLVLRARCLNGSAFVIFIGWKSTGWDSPRFGIVVEDKPSEISCEAKL